ncbi:MAG: XRE family transcriptional regulator [Clostridia bacterium]|nr:XRE family transcriptional regulator [Clostridia bacterium]
MFENSILAANITRCREQMNMTQAKLAGLMFVTAQTVSKWENGLSVPEIENLCELADIFGVSTDALLRSSSREIRRMIAIDGGGTKTEFLHFDENGRILGRIVLGGSNPNAVGIDAAITTVLKGIELLNTGKGGPCGIFAGIAGCAIKKNSERIAKEILKHYPKSTVQVDSDIHCVLNSVRRVKNPIAVICGTGSVVYADDGKELHRIGGWGYLFDKAGSGYDIGRDAICAALDVENGFAPAGILSDAVHARAGRELMNNFDELYSKGRDYIASFAREAFAACRQGDTVAREIISKSADRLAFLINHAHNSFDTSGEVIISGGLTAHKDILEPMLKARLNNDVRLIFPEFSQIYGACLKCMKICGININETEFDNSFRSYKA